MKDNQSYQGALLASKRFLPLFITQFFSAINDNVYKQSVLILLIFQAATLADGALYSNIAAGLFILPFFLLELNSPLMWFTHSLLSILQI